MALKNSLQQKMFVSGLIAGEGKSSLLDQLRVPLEPQDLSDPVAQAIFKAVRVASNYNTLPTVKAISEIILIDGLAGSVDLDSVLKTVTEYAEPGLSSPAAFNNSAALILESASRERIGQFASGVVKLAGMTGTATQQFEKISEELQKVKPVSVMSTARNITERFERSKKTAERQRAMIGKRLLGLPIEFDQVATSYIKSFKRGNVYTVMGRPGRGKSLVLDQIAERNFRMGFKVMLFHLEDSEERKMMRQTARLTGCTLDELEAGDPRGQYDKAYSILAKWSDSGGQLIWVHCPGATAEWIHREVQQQGGADLVIIDYAQKLSQEHYKGSNEAIMLSKAINACKEIAENPVLNCAVVLGSQVTEGKGDVDQGWGSRAFEMYSQAVIAINRKRLGDDDPSEVVNGVELAKPGDLSTWVRLSVTKNNDGPMGVAWLVSLGARFRFEGVKYRALRRRDPKSEVLVDALKEPTDEFYKAHEMVNVAYDAVTPENLPLPSAKAEPVSNSDWKGQKEKDFSKNDGEPFTGEIPF